MTGSKRRTRTFIALGLIVGALTIGLVTAKMYVLPQFHLPEPTGPYGVGTVTEHWIDATRTEILAPEPGAPRELMAQFWYPADPVPSGQGPYISESDSVIPGLARTFGMPPVVLNHLGGATTNAVEGAAVASDTQRFPVIVMLSGLGGFRQSTTFFAEELVSYGFVVVGIDQPYTAAAVAFPDGRTVEMPSMDEIRPLVSQSYLPAAEAPHLGGVPLEEGIIPFLGADVTFVIDELERLGTEGSSNLLASHLDLDRIGVAGVSLGGIVTGEVASEDPRVTAALMMDAPVPSNTVEAGLDVPTMFLTRPPDTMRLERERAGGWPEEEIDAHHRTMRDTFDSLAAAGYFVQIPEISHLDFTDAPVWSPALRWLGVTGPRDGAYAHRVINDYALSFWQQHLNGAQDTSFDQLTTTHPEVMLEVRETTPE